MHCVRWRQIARTLSAGVVLVAWFAVSNHCGLAMTRVLHGVTRAGHECCPSQNNNADHHNVPNDPSKVCCKQLRLLPIAVGAKLVDAHKETFCFETDWSVAVAWQAAEEACRANYVGTAIGPPYLRSFAEAVLQRSLLSHAPPVTA
jgi:hypothetical protein